MLEGQKSDLEGVVLTASCNADPLIIQYRALQITSPAALEPGVGIWQLGIRLCTALQALKEDDSADCVQQSEGHRDQLYVHFESRK